MFCSKCGNQLPDDAKFCRKCGASIGGDISSEGNLGGREAVDNSGVAAVGKINKKPIIIIGVVCVLVVCVIIFALSKPKSEEKDVGIKEENIMVICESDNGDYVITESEIQPALTILRDYIIESGYELSDDAFFFMWYEECERNKSGDKINIDSFNLAIFDGHYKYLFSEFGTTISGETVRLTMDGYEGRVEPGKDLYERIERKNNNFYGIPNSELGRTILEGSESDIYN